MDIEAQAEALIAREPSRAYSLARRREDAARSPMEAGYWAFVARVLAQRIGKQVSFNAARGMPGAEMTWEP